MPTWIGSRSAFFCRPGIGRFSRAVFDEDKCYVIKNGKTINIGHLLDSRLFAVNTKIADMVTLTLDISIS